MAHSRILFALSAAALMACGSGEITVGSHSAAEEELYCYGNPDSVVICVPKDEVWTCDALPNGKVKCSHTPDGESGWSCVEEDGKTVCQKQDAPGGGAGWDCTQDAEGLTTCTSVGGSDGFSPPGGGDWDCTLDEFGVVCLGDQPADDGGDEQPDEGKVDDGDDDEAKKPPVGDFRSQTPGGWGAPASGNNAGAYRDANFPAAFPNGLSIGCSDGHTALFTSAKAIENFIPNGSTPGVLDKDYVDPLATPAGILAGQVVALSLSVGFDGYDPSFGASDLSIEHLVATSGVCKGMTAGQILALANAVLGGCNQQMAPSAINECVDAINNNFVDGEKSGGYLVFP